MSEQTNKTPPELKQLFYSVEEAAEILRVHPNTIRNLIKADKIKAEKIGRQWRIRRDTLLNL